MIKRILILDDKINRLDMFRKKLMGPHTEIITVKKSWECINELRKNGPWDLCFLDHDLGINNGNGMDVANWLEQNQNKNPGKTVVHSFNSYAGISMSKIIKNAEYHPGAWEFI